MLLIPCPWCGPRPELEFRHAGEAHLVRRTGEGISDEEWSFYLYARENPKGSTHERWRHVNGCGRFFNAVRDTVSDKIAATYKPGAPRPSAPASSEHA